MTDGERDLVQFSRELDRVMKARGWTQRQLADKTGLSKGAVSNMLAGVREGMSPQDLIRPRRDQVLKLAAGLDDSPLSWLRLAGHRVEEDGEVDEEQALLDRIARGAELLDAGDRRVFARMIEGYLIRSGYISRPADDAVQVHSEIPYDGARSDAGQVVDDVPAPDPAGD